MGATSKCIRILLLLQLLCSTLQCPERERSALVAFKAGVIDKAGRLSSWADGSDCCKWHGVGCSDATGNVVRVDLRNTLPIGDTGKLYNRGSLRGNISSSLLDLKHLRYLDLSKNYFHRISIPGFFGSFGELRYLNLSLAGFTGIVPSELGNLSTLRRLDLHSYPFDYGQYVIDGRWLSGLSSLRYLDMGGLDLSSADNWLYALNALPYVTEIRLPLCKLHTIPQTLPGTNFTALSFLDLSLNCYNSTLPEYLLGVGSLKHLDIRDSGFEGVVPDAIGNLTSLEYLDLSAGFVGRVPRTLANLCNLRTLHLEHVVRNDSLLEFGEAMSGCIKNRLETLDLSNNGFADRIPDWIGDLEGLKILDLSMNSLYGPIPKSIGRLSNLEILGLSMNGLTGPVSEEIGQLSKLITLDLTYNTLRTTLTEAHFANLKSLTNLDLFNSSLTLNISPDWLPPFRLETAYARNIRQGPRFPSWLKNQDRIRYIDMSGAGISDDMPDWFWNVTPHVTELYLSDNEIRGVLPKSLRFPSHVPVRIDLSSNLFVGRLPRFPSSVHGLYLSNNSLSGTIPPAFADAMPNLTYFSVSTNKFGGTIPSSICTWKRLKALDLSKNKFSGRILDCWDQLPELQYLNLESNNLFGNFPRSIASAASLQLLDMSYNDLSGPLPDTFASGSINTLDLGNNNFTGTVPSWIGDRELTMRILSLASNAFTGDVPSRLCNLRSLHVLDLSNNGLSGSIPRCFGNLSGMKTDPDQKGVVYYDDFSWDGLLLKMWVATKGRYLEYGKLLSLLTFLDLSANELVGGVPEELTELRGLQSLNVSRNRLTGGIAVRFGELKSLETLDLSRNGLSGPIPPSLSGLHFLSNLDLSYNRLVGRIPSGGQLQALVDPSIYAHNDGLCGFPLSVSCDARNAPEAPSYGEGEGGERRWFWFSLGTGPGFVVGFWTVWGVLILGREWREAYFRFVDRGIDAVLVLLNMVSSKGRKKPTPRRRR